MISFWEQQSFTTYDYVVVGSGIVGLSSAISIKEKTPNSRVLVLEKGLLPTGASTKNAGFACFGSLTELLDDLNVLSEEDTLALVTERVKGLEKLRNRLGDKAIDYLNYGGYELVNKEDMHCLDQIDRLNDLLSSLFDKPVFVRDDSKIEEFGFKKEHIPAMVFNPYEGQIHTGKMMASLLAMAREKDIEVLTGANVERLEDNGNDVSVTIKGSKYDLLLKAKKVACCTNAFTKELLPDINLKPGRGIVLVTKPIKNLKLKGVFHSDKGFYYFRNFEDRVIYGGGRNLDFKTEETTDFTINQNILDNLKKQLDTVILPDTPYEIDQTWAGIMAFGENKKPIVKSHTENIAIGVRLGGMGVAIGSRLGEKMAEMVV